MKLGAAEEADPLAAPELASAASPHPSVQACVPARGARAALGRSRGSLDFTAVDVSELLKLCPAIMMRAY